MDEKIKENLRRLLEPKFILMFLGILVLGVIVVASIVRERIVNQTQNQVAVAGVGKVSYQSDIANVTLGVQIDKVTTSQEALNQLNEKMTKIIAELEQVGIAKEDIETQNYSLNTQYDYKNGSQSPSGYDANQKLVIKIKDIQTDKEKISKVLGVASVAGSNQVLGITFDVSNLNDLKQKARLLAIADAKVKAVPLAQAAGVRLGKVVNWFENVVQSAENPAISSLGYGAGPAMDKAAISNISPQVPTGTQDIVVEIDLTYQVR